MLEKATRGLWQDLVFVHRLQFPLPISYLGYALMGACFAVSAPGQLLSWPVLTVAVANVLLIVGPLAFNVAVDVELDSGHREKGYLAVATRHFGGNGLLILSAAETAAGVVLTGAVSVLLGRPQLAAAALGTVLAHVLYNVEPFHLKRRGLAGAIVFGFGATTGPALVTYLAVAAGVPAPVWLVFAGLGVMAGGRTAWWSLPDRAADLAANQDTPAARYGLRGTSARACLLMGAGLLLLAWGLSWLFGPVWCVAGIAAYAVFLADVLKTGRHPASAKRMLRRAMPVIALGDLFLAVIPLVAG
ncbi:UbiA family prenyltransferase [Amycolatopsis sp. GM8]|uniref:UbiA family prenyltransferase n=1 Tax=Amycolatopsis sp. GM8 TaxID=2896530 RepID=UPI001F43CF29|nr:UbiA family prenyltransferase [Amycolatopsis sp. GM8]